MESEDAVVLSALGEGEEAEWSFALVEIEEAVVFFAVESCTGQPATRLTRQDVR